MVHNISILTLFSFSDLGLWSWFFFFLPVLLGFHYCSKDYEQKQLRDQGVYLILYLRVHHEWKSGRILETKIEAKVMLHTELLSMACSSCVLCTPGPPSKGCDFSQWAVVSHINH